MANNCWDNSIIRKKILFPKAKNHMQLNISWHFLHFPEKLLKIPENVHFDLSFMVEYKHSDFGV